MKKILFFGLTLLLVSCQQIKYRDVIGMWILDKVDGQEVLSKDVFVCDYQLPTSQILASGYLFADNDNRWVERDTYRYSIRYNTIIVSGQDALGAQVKLRFVDNVFTDSTWTYTLNTSRIDGVNFLDGSRYTLRRLGSKGYSQALLGNWLVKYANGIPAEPTCCQMHPDGTFSYYQYDSVAQQFKLKEDNDGRFFLYGDFVALNYSNSTGSSAPGRYYDCWEIEKLDDDTMHWFMRDTTGILLELHRLPLSGLPAEE